MCTEAIAAHSEYECGRSEDGTPHHQGPVLVEQQGVTVRAVPLFGRNDLTDGRRASGLMLQHQRERSGRTGLIEQTEWQADETDRLDGQVKAGSHFTRRGEVVVVEDETAGPSGLPRGTSVNGWELYHHYNQWLDVGGLVSVCCHAGRENDHPRALSILLDGGSVSDLSRTSRDAVRPGDRPSPVVDRAAEGWPARARRQTCRTRRRRDGGVGR